MTPSLYHSEQTYRPSRVGVTRGDCSTYAPAHLWQGVSHSAGVSVDCDVVVSCSVVDDSKPDRTSPTQCLSGTHSQPYDRAVFLPRMVWAGRVVERWYERRSPRSYAGVHSARSRQRPFELSFGKLCRVNFGAAQHIRQDRIEPSPVVQSGLLSRQSLRTQRSEDWKPKSWKRQPRTAT